MDILHSLGQLFLGSVPTIIFVLLFYFFLRWAFFRPIERAMAERDAQIEGARQEAASVEAAAQQEREAYQQALRKARGEIYAAKLLKAMRARAQEEVLAAKKRINAEVEGARAQVEREAPLLAGEIVRLILERPASARGGAT